MGGGLGPCVSGRECSGSRQIVLKEKSEKNGNPGPFARFIDFIGNPTDKRVGFLKITLINKLGGVIS